jgi:uncharacterized membrane protein
VDRWRRPPHVLLAISLVGIAISVYLTVVKLIGVAPICGPSGGCEVVEASRYSSIFGVPVALLGIGYSGAIAALAVNWSRRGPRPWLTYAYALGLVGLLVEAYLVYLELFVIHAICLWCTAYGVTVLAGWLVTVVALRRAPA